MRRTIGALISGLLASLALLVVELERLRRLEAESAAVDLALLRRVFLDLLPDFALLGLLAAAGVLALSSARHLVGGRPRLAAGLPVLASAPLLFWVAAELAQGRGVVRAGLAPVVLLAVPLVAGAAVWLLGVLVERLRRPGRWPAALFLLVVLVAGGVANRSIHVGRYQPVHETLQLFELFGAATLIQLLLRRSAAEPSAIRALAGLLLGLGLGLQVISIWPLGAGPGEALRSLYDRRGFHSAALLRWRARLDPREIDDGGLDESLIDEIRVWNDTARDFASRLDSILPDRRVYNLLLVSIDTLRHDRLGCCGAEDSRTPNIDRMAAESTVFLNAYSQYPSTALSTESLFHGRYPRATGIYRKNKGELSPEDLRVLRLSEVARMNGFRTAAAIAFTAEWMQDPLFARSLESFELVNPRRRGAPRLDGEYFADSAMAAMTELQSDRFFVWFHLFDPHHAYEYRPGYARSDDAQGRYDGEVRYADEQFGRVMDFMKERGLWEHTVVVLTSDHGEAFGEKGLRYHGSSLQEAQVRVPLIVHVPGLPAQKVSEIAENVDIYQTVATLLALDGVSENQGSDLSPLIVRHDEFASRFPDFAYSELPDDVRELSTASSATASYREGRWKLIRHMTLDYSELYDVVDDPTESRDLAKQETAERLRLERRLRTMARLTEQFGRSLTSAEIRYRKVESARGRLRDDDPYKIFSGLTFVAENDLHELKGLVGNIAFSEGQYPELRTRALRLLAAWQVEGWRRLAIAWLEDPNPVFRWVATGLLVDQALATLAGRGGLGPEEVAAAKAGLRATEDQEPLRVLRAALQLVLLRLEGRDGSAAPPEAELVRQIIEDPLADSRLRRRLVLAAIPILADPLRFADEFGETQDRLDLLDALWHAGRREDWLEYARRLLPDRYLPALIKEPILERALAEFPTPVVEELAVPLLARWDPAFHELASASLATRLGAARVRVLQRCHGRIADGRDLLATGNHAAAVAAFTAAAEFVPGSQAGLGVELDRLRSLVALDRWEEARNLRAGLRTRAEASGSASLLRRAQALDLYLEEPQGLASDTRVMVTGVELARQDRRFVAAGGEFRLEVEIANEDRRPLLGGPFRHGGRLRVLWTDPDGGETIYGSEYVLASDLLPGERRRISMTAIAPERPGRWRARLILNEHEGDRFHVHEGEGSEFAVVVVRPHLGPPDGLWSPVEILGGFAFDPSLEGRQSLAGDGALGLIAESYEGAFRSRPLGLDGRPRRLRLAGSWYSGIDLANLVRVDLVPLPGFDAVPATFADIKWDGGDFAIEVTLPPAVGLYQLEIRIGYRQGVLRLSAIEFE